MPPSSSALSSLVTLLDPSLDSKSLHASKIISLTHPQHNEPQDYLFLPGTPKAATILQIQSLDKPFGSFMVGSRVVSNGALHVATRVDPLYFVLHQLSATTNTATKWQPLDQLGIPSNVHRCLSSAHQYLHLCASNDQLGDMVLYKFQEARALAWLTRKYDAAKSVLERQLLTRKKQLRQQQSDGGGAFIKTFHFVEEEAPLVVSAEDRPYPSAEQRTLEYEACQVVCDHLSPEWSTKFVQHLNLPVSIVSMTTAATATSRGTAGTTPKRSWEGMAGSNTQQELEEMTMGAVVVSVEKAKHAASVQKKFKAQSSGLKQLAKVKTKGMKSMSSFFGVKK
jgi:hypothetical protein